MKQGDWFFIRDESPVEAEFLNTDLDLFCKEYAHQYSQLEQGDRMVWVQKAAQHFLGNRNLWPEVGAKFRAALPPESAMAQRILEDFYNKRANPGKWTR